jgi:nucleoside 2-deoxyribosyltransferase
MDASASRPRCYVASALGFNEAGAHYYKHVFLPALRKAVTPVDPWALTTTEELADARAGRREREFALEVGARNADAIRSCKLLVAHLDGQEVDSGTAAEIGFAAALGLCRFGLRSDLRQSGEPGVNVNLQVEHFIVASGGSVCVSLEELVGRLTESRG